MRASKRQGPKVPRQAVRISPERIEERAREIHARLVEASARLVGLLPEVLQDAGPVTPFDDLKGGERAELLRDARLDLIAGVAAPTVTDHNPFDADSRARLLEGLNLLREMPGVVDPRTLSPIELLDLCEFTVDERDRLLAVERMGERAGQ